MECSTNSSSTSMEENVIPQRTVNRRRSSIFKLPESISECQPDDIHQYPHGYKEKLLNEIELFDTTAKKGSEICKDYKKKIREMEVLHYNKGHLDKSQVEFLQDDLELTDYINSAKIFCQKVENYFEFHRILQKKKEIENSMIKSKLDFVKCEIINKTRI